MRYDEIQQIADQARADSERPHLRTALEAAGWVVGAAARALDCTPSTLRKALERHPELSAELGERGRGPGQPAKNRR